MSLPSENAGQVPHTQWEVLDFAPAFYGFWEGEGEFHLSLYLLAHRLNRAKLIIDHMRVLFLSNEQFLPLSGGGSVGNYHLVRKLVERGHEVTVATPIYLGSEEVRRVEMENNIVLKPFSPFYLHRNISLRGPKYVLYGFLYTFHLLRLLLSGRYDVVFVRNCLLAFPALLLRPLAKCFYALSMTDFLTGFLHNNKSYPAKAVELLFKMERSTARHFDIVYVITPEMKRMLAAAGCHASKVHVSHDGVDTALFDPSKVDEKEVNDIRWKVGLEKRIVLFHGTVDGHAKEKLAEIIRGVTSRSEDMVFILLGQGKKYEELRSELESDRVMFPGYVPHEEIPKYALAADIGIIPYEHTFNSNIIITLKLLEYLAMGLPVVSTNLKSIDELFGAYEFVRLSPTTEDFIEKVLSAGFQEKSGEAVNYIKELYSWDKVTSRMVDALEEKYGKEVDVV
ncbi:MAG: glycosyltransferase [Candidatus Altiarchaeales archaeon]|nr:glycosyltransferase [Candidatus Altiarchaeales archaeon]MBD3417063.1 glycosyltransferase [Candidatus Altiarchaeales archaeon]